MSDRQGPPLIEAGLARTGPVARQVLVVQVHVQLVPEVLRRLPELPEGPPHRPPHFGKPFGPEHDQGDEQDDDELCGTDVEQRGSSWRRGFSFYFRSLAPGFRSGRRLGTVSARLRAR